MSPHDETHFWVLEEDSGKLAITDGPYRKRGVVRRYFLRDFKRYTSPYNNSKLEKLPTDSAFPLLIFKCLFCGSPLKTFERLDCDDLEIAWEREYLNKGALEFCDNCSYWRFHHVKTELYGSRGVLGFHNYASYISKLREYDQLPEGCLTEIAQQLRMNAHHWHLISPLRLEQLVADIFKANYESAEVIHVGKPDDGGVDVLLVDSDARKCLIQVKRREKPNSAEGVSTVRNLLGTMLLENSAYGIVVSTADHFTYRAYQAAGRASEYGMTVNLVDRGLLNRMLDPLLPDRPWLDIIDQHFPDFADSVAEKIPSNRQYELFTDYSLDSKFV